MRKIICLLLFVNAVINETNAQWAIAFNGVNGKDSKASNYSYEELMDFGIRGEAKKGGPYTKGVDDAFMQKNDSISAAEWRRLIVEKLNYINRTDSKPIWVDEDGNRVIIEEDDIEEILNRYHSTREMSEDEEVTFYSMGFTGTKLTGSSGKVTRKRYFKGEKMLTLKSDSETEYDLSSMCCANPTADTTKKKDSGDGYEEFDENGGSKKTITADDGRIIINNYVYGSKIENSGNATIYGSAKKAETDLASEESDELVVEEVVTKGKKKIVYEDDTPYQGDRGVTITDSYKNTNVNINDNGAGAALINGIFSLIPRRNGSYCGTPNMQQCGIRQPYYPRPPRPNNQGQGYDYGGVPGNGGQGSQGQDYGGVD